MESSPIKSVAGTKKALHILVQPMEEFLSGKIENVLRLMKPIKATSLQ
jgi:hypothetical protein